MPVRIAVSSFPHSICRSFLTRFFFVFFTKYFFFLIRIFLFVYVRVRACVCVAKFARRYSFSLIIFSVLLEISANQKQNRHTTHSTEAESMLNTTIYFEWAYTHTALIVRNARRFTESETKQNEMKRKEKQRTSSVSTGLKCGHVMMMMLEK